MRFFITGVLLMLLALPSWPQDERIDSLLNEVFGSEEAMMKMLNPSLSFWCIYGGASADNKTFYAGREIGDGMYSLRGNVYLFHSRGFFVGASGLWYSQLKPAYRTTILSAGISAPLNQKKSLIFRTFYSRYFYNDPEAEAESIFKNNLGAALSVRNQWIGARVSCNLLFGKEFGANFTTGVFSNVPLLRFGDYNSLNLRSEALLLIGSETVEYETQADLGGQQQDSQTAIITDDHYGLLNTQLYLPLCLYIGNLDLELAYVLNFPFSIDKNTELSISSYFSFSVGYMLPLN